MTNVLSVTGILDACDLAVERVEVPEWNGIVLIKQLSAAGILKLQAQLEEDTKNLEGLYLVLVATIVKEDGTPLFTAEDIPRLKEKNLSILHRLQRVALRINTMVSQEPAELKNGSGEAATAASPTV
jgi:hypothetical protein